MNVEIKNPLPVTLKNGKPAISGVCPNCGTYLADYEDVEKPEE